MKMLVRTYRSATSTHADICIIDIIPSCCQTNITHTRQSTRALNRSAVAPRNEPQAVWLCVTHRTFLPHGSYETVKIDYVNLRLYLSERMCSYIPHTKNNLLALCSKNSKKQHAKQSDSQTQSDFLTKIIDYLTNSLTGDAVDDERTPKQIQSDITHHTNLVGSYLSQPNQLGQTNHPILLSSWPLHRKVTWKLRSQPNLPSSRSLHRNTWKLKLNTYRPHPRKIRIIAPSHMDRPYLLKEKEKLTIITMMMKSNTQDSESSSLASINYQIDDDQ